MKHAFTDRLQWLAPLEPDDRALLQTLCEDIRHVGSKRDVISDGEQPNHVHLMISGWAARYKILTDGKRQITAFLLPGDFCDAHITLLKRMDHGIATLRPAEMAYICRDKMDELFGRPAIAKALWFASLIDEGVLRAWIVNLGLRDAAQRVAHLMCELHARLKNVEAATDEGFNCPLTQEELSDALSLTTVHVNRMPRRLREEDALIFSTGLGGHPEPSQIAEVRWFRSELPSHAGIALQVLRVIRTTAKSAASAPDTNQVERSCARRASAHDNAGR